MTGAALIGRNRERATLDELLDGAANGSGGLLLIAGAAGEGKTRLAEAALADAALLTLKAAARQQGKTPYGPIASALRSYRRTVPEGLRDHGSLWRHLSPLLPELGESPAETDQLALIDALGDALGEIAERQPTVVLLDDLQWADEATLGLLSPLAVSAEGKHLLLLAVYRSDEVPRGHPLRRLRTELRQAGRLRQLAVEPLSREHAAELVGRVLGRPPGPRLAGALYDRTEGVPFFLEELAAALATGGRLEERGDLVELRRGDQLPLPERVRDAVLLRADRLSERARHALEVAAVAGLRFDLDLLEELTEGGALDEVFELGFLVEQDEGSAAFRHPLVREALYRDVRWTRRREHHRRVAERLERRRAAPQLVAEHWLAAREPGRARPRLLEAADAFCDVHAYRDAARFAQSALELWPQGEDEPGRLIALERLGHCAQLSGELADAARAWEEVAEARRDDGGRVLGEIERRLGRIYELQGTHEHALAARQKAADAFAAAGLAGEAAAERLAMAQHLSSAERANDALEVVTAAAVEIERAESVELRARGLALEAQIRAQLGQSAAGIDLARQALGLALDEDLVAQAAEAYYGLACVLEYGNDHAGAADAFMTAYDFCRERGLDGMAEVCFACLAVVLITTGEWRRAAEVCRGVLDAADSQPLARAIASGELGLIHALRGERRPARRLLPLRGEALA